MAGEGYITDPALLEQLNAPSQGGSGDYVTDPELLAKLNEQRGGVLSEIARPVTTYWPTHKEVVKEATETMGHGVEQLTKPTGGDLWESAKAAAKGVAGVGGGAIQYAISPITAAIRSGLSRPLEETTGLPKQYTEFATELAIPGIGLTRPPRIPMVTRTPVTKGGPEAEAGKLLEFQIRKEGGDPEAVRRALEEPPTEIVPGSKPTTYQHTGDIGAGQVERGATTRHPAAFQERFGEQNAARLEAIENIQRSGSPEEVATHLRNAMRTETAQTDEAVRLAQQRAWEESQQLGGTYDPTTYGNVFRRELQQAEDAARASERELWRAVDPDGTLRANPQPMQELERGIYGPESMSQAGAASITPAEREITALIQNYPPVIPFQELRDLRSLTSTALREELYTRGQTPAYARLSRLRQGIEDAIPRSFTEEGAAATGVQERLRAASAATRERAETFRPLRDVTRREGTQGPYRMGEASVPGRIVQSGARGYDSASSYLRAVGNERGLPDLQDAVAASMRREVIGPDGTINPRKLDGWLKRYQDTLRAIDERDGGAFSQRLRNVGTAQEELDTAIARQSAVSKQQGKDELRNIIGAVDDGDITRMIVGILGRANSEGRMRELVTRLTGNDAAIEGARRAVVEHLRTRLLSNMEAAATGKPIIRAEQFQNFVKHNEKALRQLMTPEQVEGLKSIARDIQQRTNRTQQTGIRGRSTTEQDRRIMREQEESALKSGAKEIGKIAGKGLIDTIAAHLPVIGPLGVRAGEAVLKAQMAKWKAKGINTIQELVDEAMLNPEVARELLSKSHKTVIRKGIRAPFQTGGGVPAIGGTGGRSLGTTTPPGPRAARAGTGQALSDGGEAGEQQPAPLSGSRERLAAALQSSVAGGAGALGGSGKRKPSTALTREEIVKQLKGRGLSTAGWEAPSGFGESHAPDVDSRADGGEVGDDDKLPLPGQSRGLGRAPDEELPAMRRNKAGETLPGYIVRNWGEGLAHLAGTPGRVYREGMTDEDVDFGPAMALNMMGARAPTASQPGIGMFGGRGAKTANLDALKRAEEMRAEGAPRESTWNRTGWFRDPAGDWMFEIPDTGSYVKPLERVTMAGGTRMSRPGTYAANVPLEDVLHHPRYFEAYPQFKDMPTTLELGVAPGGGYQPPGRGLGLIAQMPGDVGRMEIRAPHANEGAGGKHGDYPARRIILHEGMHGVQGAEGFTSGANPQALPYSPRQLTNMVKKATEEAGLPWERLGREDRVRLVNGMRMKIYREVLGEAWARAVEARRNLSPEALMHRPPWKDLDVPWGDVRIPKDEGVALGLRPTGRVSPWRKPEPFADGGEIDWEEDKLPLPGQSRGLRSTAGPTVTSTTREEDIPAPRTNKAGETLPTYVLKSMGQGLLDLATAPKRAYTGELSEEEALGFGPQMGLVMTGMGRGQGTLGVGRSGGRGRGRRPPPREPVEETPPPPMGHNMPPEELPVERRRTSSLGLRDMPIEQAIKQAQTEQHIIPSNPKVREGYVGAPDWVKTPEDLAKMRADLDAQIEAGMSGAKWYRVAQEGIKEMAGPNPAKQHQLAQQKAVTSAQATPETNLGFALQGHNALLTGKPLEIVRTGDIAERMAEGAKTGEIGLGPKTGIYARHMDPTMEDPSVGTNDIWHARAFGYENPEGGLKAHQHAFMDAETVLAVHRANARKLGGRSDWTPGEIQAAPWVFNKAQGLQEQFGWSPEKAMEEAVKTYNSFFDKHTAFGTHEATPGVGTRHLPGIAKGTQAEREAFAADPRSSWRDPSGRDIIYQGLGMYTRPSVKATGVFEGPEGLEINPAEAARPMVSFEGGAGKRQVDPASRRLMDAAEAARAYMDVQNAGAWSIPIEKQQVGQSTSAYIRRPGGGPMPIEDIKKLQEIGGRHGLPGVIDYGEGTALTSFGGGPTGKQLGKSALAQEVEQAIGIRPGQVKLDTGYIDYQSLWGGKQGTGAVTRALQEHLISKDAPAILKRLDASPELRQAVAARLERDAEVARQTGQPIRRDVQRARAIFVKSGFEGLFRALAKGAALPAVAFAPLVELLQQQEAPVE